MSASQLIKSMEFVPLDSLISSDQNVRSVRETDTDFKELVASIKGMGIVEPLAVRQTDDFDRSGQYKVIAGGRRFEAIKEAFKSNPNTQVPVAVMGIDTPLDEYTVSAIENLHRSQLTSHDLALMVAHYKAQRMTGKQIAKKLHKSESWVSTVASGKDFHPGPSSSDESETPAKKVRPSEDIVCPYCGEIAVRFYKTGEGYVVGKRPK